MEPETNQYGLGLPQSLPLLPPTRGTTNSEDMIKSAIAEP